MDVIRRMAGSVAGLRSLFIAAAICGLMQQTKAHQISFNSSMTYSDTQPSGDAASVANW